MIADGELTVRFSVPLADDAAGRTITLVGERGGPVAASIRYDADGQGFTLARADGKPLQYDRYSLFIGDDAFVSRDGALLDGDADGTAGGGYRASILFASPSAGTAELPDFTRGPGEHVDVPLEDRAGLQVRFTSDGGVKTLNFRVTYDPALLRIDGILRGADLPADAVVAFRPEAAAGGGARASIRCACPAGGTAEVPDLTRGPGEHFDVPRGDRAGLQVRFTSDGGVKTLNFRVTYDPALRRIDGILRGADLPADAVVAFRTEAAPGGKRVAIISIVSDTPIPAGNRWLLSLHTTAPERKSGV